MLSDFTGLVAAHDAYTRLSPTKRHESFPGFPYKDEQLFFITYCLKFCNKYADVSPSSKYASWRDRCEVPLRMMGAFGQAYRCPAGSPMWIYNESRRCTFW
ncbi:hypothetical protein HPB48_007325 [Haemaphysalis longicornis]|uniref:Peptidase M13 C-terminal domain-containing protein n=1 Tax=Haemaphysalis longicornis TaxID=44386 RepID=A0A9J6G7A3_HAELO|nr:hypothetical protein HPB48_007325 [Haemaphysalis longicornis]